MAKDYRLEKRKFVIGGIALTIVLIYLIRLFVLQITTDDYKKNADSNAFLNKIQYPSRGAIYDRNGKLLVFNQPAYDITLVPKEVENLDTLDLCESLGITRAQFLKIMSAAAIRDIPDIPTSCSCHNSLRRSAVSSRRNCSSFPVFIFSGVRSGNIHTMLPPMLWGISVRYPLKIWRRMKRDTTFAEIM